MQSRSSSHKHYFGAGPASLPPEVLQQASEAVLSYDGLSILEIPHRGPQFGAILEESKALVRSLCGISADDYEVLWMQGGGRLQFAMTPMNFMAPDQTAAYIDSGFWAAEAAKAAACYGPVQLLASSAAAGYTCLPPWPLNIDPALAYVHLTTNNTIYGTQWAGELPETPVPLICDMSSDILSGPRNYNRCALFYAVAQKNLGPAGVTLVVVRKDMLARIRPGLPPVLDYSAHARHHSVLNTPPVFAIYTSLLCLRWMQARGMEAIGRENEQKAALLYAEVERNSLFHTRVAAWCRSRMNVVFHMDDTDRQKRFTDYCAAQDIVGIEGHRSLGGLRASLYNAVRLESVAALVQAMQEFERLETDTGV